MGLQAAKQSLSIPAPAPAVLGLRAVLSQHREVSAALWVTWLPAPCAPGQRVGGCRQARARALRGHSSAVLMQQLLCSVAS